MTPRTLSRLALFTASLAASLAHGGPGNNDPRAVARDPAPAGHVDLVIALDTSSSMDGLIDAARQKLWDVVNLLAHAKPQPVLRVGLLSYGNTSYARGDGWVRKDADLTSDLDAVYSKLFALRTGGGDEYVARAVQQATRGLQWDQDGKTLKILFVAGNEAANQDPLVSLDSAVQQAREKGIFVNTIYCGRGAATEAALWRQVATMGSGKYAAIDQNQVVAVATPMDAELARLSVELNHTYVAFGARGGDGATAQMAQDKNAASVSTSAAASRAVAKSGGLYSNEQWDLVDAKRKGAKDVAALKAEELPADMRAMKPAERVAHVEKKAQQRDHLQKQISEIAQRREQFLKAERGRRGKGSGPGFDDALDATIRSQAESAGYSF